MANKLPKLLASTLLIPALLTSTLSFAQDKKENPFSAKIKAAMKAETRSDKDKERDANRLPVQTLEFFGIKEDMKVLELIPGGGWYTSLLAPALADKGELHVGVGTGRVKTLVEKDPAFSKVKVVNEGTKLKWNPDIRLITFDAIEFDEKNYDAVLTFRNYHNMTVEARMELNKHIFKSLKPGGIYGVIDHTRRHMEQDNRENHRRADPVMAIHEILQAGFEFVDHSDLHYRADDELEYEVGRKSVTGNSDRWTFLFKKPK